MWHTNNGRKPAEGQHRLLGVLDAQIEWFARDLNMQDFANTIWALAKIGREPGEREIRMLQGRTEEIALRVYAQEITSTMWAFAKRKPGHIALFSQHYVRDELF